MLTSYDLPADELQWLLAISRGPLSKEAADRRVPTGVRDSLIAKGLLRWNLGSLEITLNGQAAVARLRSVRTAAT